MKLAFALIFTILAGRQGVWAADLLLESPKDFQVFQRYDKEHGRIEIKGKLSEPSPTSATLQYRLTVGEKVGDWTDTPAKVSAGRFDGVVDAPAGGWFKLDVQLLLDGKPIASAAVEHVGIGEIFVVAGQSNSANYGEEKQQTKAGRVVAFDGKHWQLANDPQPGAGGKGGSFMPPLGDKLVEALGVPVGFVACGIGATSVREWLPAGSRFPNPPTIVGRVRQLPSGEWESKGDAYAMLVGRMKQLGPKGFRAVLWHQGESDANQKDPTRTLPGKLYREYLEKIIRDSRKDIGWEAPWFVAQVSYHTPGDEEWPDLRDAQSSLWKDGVALQGPDSDALRREWRERNGQGVHFSGPGLKQHAGMWAEKVGPWVIEQVKK